MMMEPQGEFKKYKLARHQFALCIFISVVCALLAAFGILKPANEPLDIWFQRSGSLVVLFAAIGEYYVSIMRATLRPAGYVGITAMENELSFTVKCYHFAALALVIIGTIIWGYGDLWLQGITNK
jgi:hypothetical protein